MSNNSVAEASKSITKVPISLGMSSVSQMFSYQPTIKGVDVFDDSVAEDAGLTFRGGIKGGSKDGTSVNEFISILGQHNYKQRRAIDKLYKTQFGKSMGAELTAVLRGEARDLALALVSDPSVNDATCMKVAISGSFPIFTSGGTDEDTLIEILASRSNTEINNMKTAYEQMYGKNLETEVVEDTSGSFELFLVSLLNANRDESVWEVEVENPDQRNAKVEADAEELFKASRDRFIGGDTFMSFNRILCLRSFYHLREVFTVYQKKYGVAFESDLQHTTSDHLRDGYLAVCKLATKPEEYFEEILYKSIMDQDEKKFMRVLVSRNEKDLGLILRKLNEKRGKSISDFIAAKNSASYRQLLHAVTGTKYIPFR